MSIHVPLSVMFTTSKVTRRVTNDLQRLSFRATAPGGYASASFALERPLRLQPDEIAYYGGAKIVDTRNGQIVWDGNLEDPGRASGSRGEVWQIGAIGGGAHASDRAFPYIAVDRRLDPWVTSRFSVPAAQVSTADAEDQVASIQMQFLRGTVVTVGGVSDIADVIYHAAREIGMKLARVSFDHIEGVTDTNWRIKLHTRQDDGGSPGNIVSHQAWTTSQSIAGKVGDANFTNGHNVANLRLDRDGSSVTVSDDNSWTRLRNVVVRTMLKDATGADITSGYTSDTVLFSDIVKDLLGRVLTGYDGPNALVEATTHPISQFAYPDGVTSADLFAEGMALEPAFYWAAWEANAAGKSRFEWRAWPTHVRYEATTVDGFESPGSGSGLYDRVTVRWRDGERIKTTTRTQVVPELAAAGRPREALIDLSDESGSAGNAIRVGDQFLAEHAAPPNAGRLTIARPILDADTGRMVMPWEIRPGHLMRVRGVLPRIDALNATTRDGVSVFRIVAVDFDSDDVAAQLELDSYPVTVAAALAELDRSRRRFGVLTIPRRR